MIEPLERRVLLAFIGGFRGSIDDRVLTLVGTNDAERVTIRIDNPGRVQVTTNASGSEIFRRRDFDGIVVRLRGGNDTLAWGPVDPGRPATIKGGAGNDSLDGSARNDRIFGNGGSDTLDGADGNDTVRGSGGNDLIVEGQFPDESGNDEYFGGKGIDAMSYQLRAGAHRLSLDNQANDGFAADNERDNIHRDFEILVGGLGNDSLLGSPGDDIIIGAGGFDFISGRGGDDFLRGTQNPVGDQDSDRFLGGAGRDRILADDGNIDTINAGTGRDTVDSDDSDEVANAEVIE